MVSSTNFPNVSNNADGQFTQNFPPTHLSSTRTPRSPHPSPHRRWRTRTRQVEALRSDGPTDVKSLAPLPAVSPRRKRAPRTTMRRTENWSCMRIDLDPLSETAQRLPSRRETPLRQANHLPSVSYPSTPEHDLFRPPTASLVPTAMTRTLTRPTSALEDDGPPAMLARWVIDRPPTDSR